MNDTNSLFEINHLKKWYSSRSEGFLSGIFKEEEYLKAVDDISFNIEKGEILGLAGQSGCGKSTLGELLVALQQPTDGEIRYRGEDISQYDREQMKAFRRDCQVIFQDPYESLNPRFTVSRTVGEPLKIHGIGDKEERETRIINALEDAGLRPPEKYLDNLPSELSGGERQRVYIARALVLDPDFLVADEPVSMLDVSVRTGILHLFNELREKRDMTMLYISHDLATISYLTDRTMIMYLGNSIELGPTEDVIRAPAHPYTKMLLDAVPNPDPDKTRSGASLRGEIPDPVNLPSGCRFHPNCKYATAECRESEPDLEPIERYTDGKQKSNKTQDVACYHPVIEKSSPRRAVDESSVHVDHDPSG